MTIVYWREKGQNDEVFFEGQAIGWFWRNMEYKWNCDGIHLAGADGSDSFGDCQTCKKHYQEGQPS